MRNIIPFFIVCILAYNLYSNDYSKEANYIFWNDVSLDRVDSFLFNPVYSNSEKVFIAKSLFSYKDDKAIAMFTKMYNDTNLTLQSLSIMPLVNIGRLKIAIDKFQSLEYTRKSGQNVKTNLNL